jgi:hypothetical protein
MLNGRLYSAPAAVPNIPARPPRETKIFSIKCWTTAVKLVSSISVEAFESLAALSLLFHSGIVSYSIGLFSVPAPPSRLAVSGGVFYWRFHDHEMRVIGGSNDRRKPLIAAHHECLPMESRRFAGKVNRIS